MKRLIIVIAILAGLLILPQIEAQEQQLTWGVTPDLRIRYSFIQTGYFTQSNGEHSFLHEEYEVIAAFSYFPEINQDGADTTYGHLYFVNGSMTPRSIRVRPIGNWALVQAVDSTSTITLILGGREVLKNATYFEDEATWGLRYNYTDLRQYDYDINRSFYCNITATQIFSKTDGAIVFQEVIWDYLSELDPGYAIRTYARINEYSALAIVIQQVIIVGGAFAGGAILMVFYQFKIKGRISTTGNQKK